MKRAKFVTSFFIVSILIIISARMSFKRNENKVQSIETPHKMPTDLPIDDKTEIQPTEEPVARINLQETQTGLNNLISGINHIPLDTQKTGAFQFLTLGHIYGDPNSPSEDGNFPAQSLMSFLPELQVKKPDMLVLLGDIVPNGSTEYFEILENRFLEKFAFPIFNAVGNHDVEERSTYETRYGPTYLSFFYSSAAFLIIDTEQNPCRIPINQYEMMRDTLASSLDDEKIKNIFIFMHKVLFIDNEIFADEYGLEHAFLKPNRWECYQENDYTEILSDLILPAAQIKPVYWFAGDVGAWGGNLSPYYQPYPDSGLTMIAVGIGDAKEDAAAFVSVSETGDVNIEFISLTGEEMMQVEEYNLDYWLSREEE